jgi:hypothetical protein
LKKSKWNQQVWKDLVFQNCGGFFKFLWFCGLGNITNGMMEKIFKPNDQDAFNECRNNLLIVLDKLDERITNKKTEYLMGSSIGIEDIAMSALAAPLVNPKFYCNGEYVKQFTMLYDKDLNYKKDVDTFSQRPFGLYVLKIYKEFRQLNY